MLSTNRPSTPLLVLFRSPRCSTSTFLPPSLSLSPSLSILPSLTRLPTWSCCPPSSPQSYRRFDQSPSLSPHELSLSAVHFSLPRACQPDVSPTVLLLPLTFPYSTSLPLTHTHIPSAALVPRFYSDATVAPPDRDASKRFYPPLSPPVWSNSIYRRRRLMLPCCGIYSRTVLVVLSIPYLPPSSLTQPLLILLVMCPLFRFSLCVSLPANLPVCLPGLPDCLARLLTCLHASLPARLLACLLGPLASFNLYVGVTLVENNPPFNSRNYDGPSIFSFSIC